MSDLETAVVICVLLASALFMAAGVCLFCGHYPAAAWFGVPSILTFRAAVNGLRALPEDAP